MGPSIQYVIDLGPLALGAIGIKRYQVSLGIVGHEITGQGSAFG
jgi:hypothetical protein